MEQHLHEEAVRHDEFGDQVHIPVSVVAEVGGGFLAWAEHVPQVGQVEGGGLRAIVAVPVEMEDLLALDGKEA